MSKYEPAEPQLSEATEARIRAAARQYVRAGGSVYPDLTGGTDADEHIAHVIEGMGRGDAAKEFSNVLAQTVPDFEQHRAVESAAWSLVRDHTEAAFLFGAFVGLEFAALTFGQLATVPTVTTRRRGRKGGAR